MSRTIASKCFHPIKKSYVLFNNSCSTFARAFSSKLSKPDCQLRTPNFLTPFSLKNLSGKMSGEFHHKRFCHYKAAVLKELGGKLEIVERKRSTKLKDNQVFLLIRKFAI